MRARELLLLCALAGCAPRTQVNIELSLAAGFAVPPLLTLSVFDGQGLVTRTVLQRPTLPGTLEVTVADDVGPLRIAALGEGVLGSAEVVPVVHRRVTAAIRLGDAVDGDGDGVPDVIDVCPSFADAEQSDGDSCGGASRCPVSGALLCDGFEEGLSRYTVRAQNGSTRLSPGDAARGAMSLQTRVSNPATQEVLTGVLDERVVDGVDEWFLRAFVLIPAGAVPENAMLVQGRNSGNYSSVALSISSRGRLVIGRVLGGNVMVEAATAFPTGRWVCVELHYARTGSSLGVRAWVDEVEAVNAPSISNAVAIDQLLLGMEWSSLAGHAPVEVRFDELLVMRERVGCAR